MELMVIRICKGLPLLKKYEIFLKIFKTKSHYTSFESLFQLDSVFKFQI
jgi:hypothetical protein